MKSDAQQLIALLFLSRDMAHKAHLSTDSYAQHMALGGFYDAIVDLADSFAEAWMGRSGKRITNIPMLKNPDGDISKVLKIHLEIIEETRDFVGDDSTLNNIIDEIIALYLSTLYKLTLK